MEGTGVMEGGDVGTNVGELVVGCTVGELVSNVGGAVSLKVGDSVGVTSTSTYSKSDADGSCSPKLLELPTINSNPVADKSTVAKGSKNSIGIPRSVYRESEGSHP